jgi:dolichyl-phosphate-mannose-protein mannosyltransferase
MTKKWFWIGIAGIFLLSLALRFWGLGRFNTLVFDEVYYAKFANNYLTNTPFFDGHPPLGKLLIALGIWIGDRVPFWQQEVNGLTGSLLSPLSYRWMNAFSGSFIPLIIAAIAYQLSYRPSFSLLAGLFATCDGIFLVESRYALINQYIIIFGLLGQLFLLRALVNQRQKCTFWLGFSGVAFGASIATKWNGLFFLLGVYLIWIIAWLWQRWQQMETDAIDRLSLGSTDNSSATSPTKSVIKNWTQLHFFQIFFYLGIIPVIVYGLIWIPHLQIDTKYTFLEIHKQILQFHEHLGGNSSKIHPYCAAWYKWPLMTRPMAYFYQSASSIKDPLPVMGPPLPSGTGRVIYDVHAMGNPILWWFGVAAILFLVGLLVQQIFIPWLKQKRLSPLQTLSVDTWIALYLTVNYAANLLPWVRVNRCIFIYHYMTAVVFAFLAIAWLVDRCLHSYHIQLRALGVTITFLILIAFVFWMPIYLGLPLSPFEYKQRMWFNSWI